MISRYSRALASSIRTRCIFASSKCNFSYQVIPTYPYEEFPPSKACEKRPIYLDYQATTPLDPRVLDAMMPLQCGVYGNAHSKSHSFGWEAEVLVENARAQIAKLLNCQTKDIVFTSGATESNNLAIKGVQKYLKGKKKHFITTQVEHKCILSSMRSLEEEGCSVTYLPVDSEGYISIEDLSNAITEDTAMLSIIYVNNEIGTIQRMSEIARVCKEKNILLHVDAAQAVGKIPIDLQKIPIDLMSISSHKMYGPKGVGALYVRSKPKRVRLISQIDGGGQERNLRSGTLATPLIVGFGKAAEICSEDMTRDTERIKKLASVLFKEINSHIPDVILNGPKIEERYNGNMNMSFAHIEGESLLMSLNNVAISSGSACTSSSLEPSYVLRAIGVGEELAHTSIRFGIGRFTTEKDIRDTCDSLKAQVGRLRDMSPLWEMAQEETKKNIVWT